MKFILEDRVCRAELFCADELDSINSTGGRELPLVFMFMGEYTEELDSQLKEYILPEIRAGRVEPFVLASFGPVEWDKDYSPWYAKGSRGRIFEGRAPQYRFFIEQTLLPYLKRSYPLSGEVYTLGYSLGGLAAFYYYFELGFSGCVSCSGSLWYPGWKVYLEEQLKKQEQRKNASEEQKKDRIYLSLGGKEKNTTDVLMCHIEEDTQETYRRFAQSAQSVFVHEPGGHMCKVNIRLAHGLCWLFAKNNKKS